MHRRKHSPIKQTNCLERDKTKMDPAFCEINSETAHLRHLGILRAEAHDEWERGTLGYVGERGEGGPSSSPVWVARCVLLEHSSCLRDCSAYNLSVSVWGAPESTLSQGFACKHFIGRCKEYK